MPGPDARAWAHALRECAATIPMNRLLIETDLGLPEIARRSGLIRHQRLSNVIKADSGLTPSQFRTRFARRAEAGEDQRVTAAIEDDTEGDDGHCDQTETEIDEAIWHRRAP